MQTEKNWLSKQRVLIFLLSVAVGIYWVVGKRINVYEWKLAGAISEILWLPMLILLFAMPLAAIGLWVKDKFDLRSLYLYAFLIGLSVVSWVMFGS